MGVNKIALRPIDVVQAYPMLTKSAAVLANWRHQKRGPRFYMVGRKPIYRPEDIEAFLFQNPVLTVDSMEAAR